MANDDYFKIQYMILKVLYAHMKNAMPIDTEEISAKALGGIAQGYRDEILGEMLENGYIKGCKYDEYIAGAVISDLEDIKITQKGIEYLNENRNMRKIEKYIGKWVERYLMKLLP